MSDDTFDPIVLEAERARITRLSRATWWREERAGRAPPRVQLSPRRVGWRLSTLNAWLAEREKRYGPPPAG